MKPALVHRGFNIRGFTMIELLVTISIATIMMTVAIPSFIDFIRNSRLTSQTNDFVLALTYAKSEAVKSAQEAVVCSSSDGTSCADSVDWETGWIVYQDTNDDGDIDADEILQVHAALTGGNTLRTGTKTEITFQHTGFSPNANATFSLCDDRGATDGGRSIIVSNQGRIRTETTAATCP